EIAGTAFARNWRLEERAVTAPPVRNPRGDRLFAGQRPPWAYPAFMKQMVGVEVRKSDNADTGFGRWRRQRGHYSDERERYWNLSLANNAIPAHRPLLLVHSHAADHRKTSTSRMRTIRFA